MRRVRRRMVGRTCRRDWAWLWKKDGKFVLELFVRGLNVLLGGKLLG